VYKDVKIGNKNCLGKYSGKRVKRYWNVMENH